MIRNFAAVVGPSLRRTLATHASLPASATRHDWTRQEIQNIYDTPLLDLVFRAAEVHRKHHDPSKIQLCTLMNIKSELHILRRLTHMHLTDNRTIYSL